MTDISFNPACKELKIAQIAHLNQLFQLLHFSLYIRPRLLWVKLYANEEKCKSDVSKHSPIRRLKRFPSSCELLMICFENSSPCFYLLGICPTVYNRKPQVITRHVLPLLWNLLSLSSNGSAGGNNTSIRASVGKLTTTLYSIMGSLFIEQASTQLPRVQEKIHDMIGSWQKNTVCRTFGAENMGWSLRKKVFRNCSEVFFFQYYY